MTLGFEYCQQALHEQMSFCFPESGALRSLVTEHGNM